MNALNKIQVIENYASGVRRIFEEYEGYIKQPEYRVSDNYIILTLYNRNYEHRDMQVYDFQYEPLKAQCEPPSIQCEPL